jgi:hypothetical protein
MNVTHHRRQHERGRSRRFALGVVASAGMAIVLLAALYLFAPHAHTSTLDRLPPTGATGVRAAALASGTGIDAGTGAAATMVKGSATFHEDADLRRLAPEPDPSAAAVAAY